MLQGVDSLQNRRAVLHILLQGQQVDGQERHAGLRKEKKHSPEPRHRSTKQRDASPGVVFGGGARGRPDRGLTSWVMVCLQLFAIF